MSIEQDNRNALINRIKERMVTADDGVTCSGGELTKNYLDIPGVLRDHAVLNLAAVVLYSHMVKHGSVTFGATMFGGPTMGAIPLVMGAVMLPFNDGDQEWFIVRDQVKDHGLGSLFVGAQPGEGDKVILIDDVVSSGRSLLDAWEQISKTGAEVVAVMPLVDRAGKAEKFFQNLRVPFLPVLTYKDLDLPPLGA
jgi:orotate phosphoribosyltransferase